jgi:hypothetical protein
MLDPSTNGVISVQTTRYTFPFHATAGSICTLPGRAHATATSAPTDTLCWVTAADETGALTAAPVVASPTTSAAVRLRANRARESRPRGLWTDM